MSLLIDPNKPIEEKPKVVVDRNEYQKQYRQKNNQKITAIERTKYYKSKYNLTDDFIQQYGEYSGDVYKILQSSKELLQKAPILKPHILNLLQKIDLELGE